MKCPYQPSCQGCETCHYRVTLPKITIRSLCAYVDYVLDYGKVLFIPCDLAFAQGREMLRTKLHDQLLKEAGAQRGSEFDNWLSVYLNDMVERQRDINEELGKSA